LINQKICTSGETLFLIDFSIFPVSHIDADSFWHSEEWQ